MPDPTLELELRWRGSVGRLRVWGDRVHAETSYERDAVTVVPMQDVDGWRIEPCDFDAVCLEFVAPTTVYRVLLDTQDEAVANLALRRALGAPLPTER